MVKDKEKNEEINRFLQKKDISLSYNEINTIILIAKK